jgi:hypothetical protein
MESNHRFILSSTERRIPPTEFQTGQLTAVLAEVEFDLREVEVPTPPAVLNTSIVLAEVDITVPENWVIEENIFTPLCDFRDQRAHRTAGDESQGVSDLILTGFATISEVTLRD